MNFISLTILNAATIALATVIPPTLPLDLLPNTTLSSQSSVSTLTPSLPEAPAFNLSLPFSGLPDIRFKVKAAIGAPLLPINAALINILYFLGIVAGQDFMHPLPARTYSTPNYRAIQITTYALTEARFILWGIFWAANDMVKFARFNDVSLDLYWEDNLVGKLKIAVRGALDLASGAGNLTRDLGNFLPRPNLTGSDDDTMRPKSAVGTVTDSDLAPPLTSAPFNALDTLSLPPSFAVSFESIAGAGKVDRNDLFLTFYNAFLHIAPFPVQSEMRSFHCESPSGNLHLHVQDVGIGCQYGQLISALIYVPKYMMEHRIFGYRETDFVVSLNGEPACIGTIIKGLLPVERRILEGSRLG